MANVTGSEIVSRVFVLRHVERDKSNTDDPQTPTPGGEVAAYAMGMELRKRFFANIVDVTSSPQPRATRTAAILMAGINGYNEAKWRPVQTDQRLDDFSSDQRFVEEVKAVKEFAKKNGLEPEQAIFLAPEASKMLEIKSSEYEGVVRELGKESGDHLVTVHGAAIDGCCLRIRNSSMALGNNGGMFDKVEGFVACFSYDEFSSSYELQNIELIRQPEYIRALNAILP